MFDTRTRTFRVRPSWRVPSIKLKRKGRWF